MNEILPYLSTENLAIGYRSRGSVKTISRDLNLKLRPGNLVCLLGSNGSGKSTLMRTLAGLQPALEGRVLIKNESLQDLKPEDLAKKLSLVLTERIEVGNLTAREIVTLGRTPYTGWLGILNDIDKEKISEAIELANLGNLLDKRAHQLSDGERQKVMVARALAQDTGLILLDEPTAHLDLINRIEMMNLLRGLARKTGKAILLSTHELDLALQTADYLWLLNHEGQLVTGTPEDLVLNGSFESAFAKAGFWFDKIAGTFAIQQKSGPDTIYIDGDEELVSWTKRALRREGWALTENPESLLTINALRKNNTASWTVGSLNDSATVGSVEALILHLRSRLSK